MAVAETPISVTDHPGVEHGHEEETEEPLGEDEILELVKETFDARELKEGE